MEDACYFKVVTSVAEEDSVVLGAEAKERGFDSSELLYVALACERIAREGPEDLQGNRLVNAAQVGSGPLRPNNALSHSVV